MSRDERVIEARPRSIFDTVACSVDLAGQVITSMPQLVDAPHRAAGQTLIAASRLDDLVIRTALLVRLDRHLRAADARPVVDLVEGCAEVVNAAHAMAREANFDADGSQNHTDMVTTWAELRPALVGVAARWCEARSGRRRWSVPETTEAQWSAVSVPLTVVRRGPVAVLVRLVDEYLALTTTLVERLRPLVALSIDGAPLVRPIVGRCSDRCFDRCAAVEPSAGTTEPVGRRRQEDVET